MDQVHCRRKRFFNNINGRTIMRFSQVCDLVENTEQEQQLLQFFKQDDMGPVETVFAKMSNVPIIGKLFAALIALSNYDSIASLKQSEYYQNLKNWNFDIDFDKKSLYIRPNDEQIKTALKVLAAIGTIITLIVICWKLCCCKK